MEASEPTAVVYACDDQPRLTVRVYFGPQDADNYTLTGSVRNHEAVHVPLVHGTALWTVGGSPHPLPTGATIEVDAEDGAGNRLGSSVYFRTAELPKAPSVAVNGAVSKSNVLTADAFEEAARQAC